MHAQIAKKLKSFDPDTKAPESAVHHTAIHGAQQAMSQRPGPQTPWIPIQYSIHGIYQTSKFRGPTAPKGSNDQILVLDTTSQPQRLCRARATLVEQEELKPTVGDFNVMTYQNIFLTLPHVVCKI